MKKTISLVLVLALGLTAKVANADFTFGTPDEIGTQAHGTLVAWGLNNHGQCNVPRGNDFVAISGGHWHSLALRVDGSLVSWGSISEAPLGNDFVAIASGSGHNLALKADGSLTAWGGTAYGKTDVPEGNDFVAIAARTEHNLALRADGSIVAWGLNNAGQCDVPEGNDFVAISAGHGHSVAQKADGSLVSWGQLTEVPPGNDFVAISAGPMHNLALRADGSLASGGGKSEWHECNVPVGNDFVQIATGSWHCLALRADGSVVAWGRNLYGECDVPTKRNFVAIAGAEGFHSIAIFATQPDWRGFYFNDFEGIVGDEWSSSKTDETPAGARGFLGQFGDENVMLTLRDLPAHTEVTVSFELFILRSWDGNNQTHGPDVWQLKVDEGPTLLHTTFANVPPDIKDFNQAYPGDYPGGDYLPYTGAAEIKTLGYTEIPSPAPDSVYRLSYTFAHAENILKLDFSGQGLQGIKDESWGLDNVKVMISTSVDFNGDGIVDCTDICMMIAHWNTDDPLYDIAPVPFGDGIVDVQDLIVLVEHLFEGIPPVEPEEVNVDEEDAGSQVELEQGQILVVTLKSNPTTGYRWEQVESQDSILEQMGEAEFKPSDTGEPPLVGAGGWEIFRFKAVNAGQMILQLLYHRPWEEGVEPFETFSLWVVVN